MGNYSEHYISMLRRIGEIRSDIDELEKEIGEFFIENDPEHHPEDVRYVERFMNNKKEL